jgi:hypothetical protein
MVVTVIVQESERQVDREQASAFARSHGLLFIECSAKQSVRVQQAFTELVHKVRPSPRLASLAADALCRSSTSQLCTPQRTRAGCS